MMYHMFVIDMKYLYVEFDLLLCIQNVSTHNDYMQIFRQLFWELNPPKFHDKNALLTFYLFSFLMSLLF